MPYRYVAVPVKAENNNTLPVVQNAFGAWIGLGLRLSLVTVVLAREPPRLKRSKVVCLNLTAG